MGFERSLQLSSICQSRGFPITQADCLATPLRDNTVDVCLCIAVIHHLSTPVSNLSQPKLSQWVLNFYQRSDFFPVDILSSVLFLSTINKTSPNRTLHY